MRTLYTHTRRSFPQAISFPIRIIAIAALLTFSYGSQRHDSRGHAAAGTITGVVFQDYNANGVRDLSVPNTSAGIAADRGIAGIIVTAYRGAGVAGTATTDAHGAYTLTATGDAPYRVEFSNLPAGFKSGPAGADSRTTVQFVAQVPASNVSLGLVAPGEYCQDNPTLATACYVAPFSFNAGAPAIVSFPYAAGSSRDMGGQPFDDFDSPVHIDPARADQVGATWGIAWSRSARRLYASAFMKKHTAYGPGGTGAIYRIDPSAPPTVSVYADLNALAGSNAAGMDVHDASNPDLDNGNAGWDAVGKSSFGGMAISDDEKRLYVMNLANRALYELPLDAPPSSANLRSRAVPANPPGCAAPNDVRPFAVQFNAGKLYVGMVCSGESTVTPARPEGDSAALQAYVYAVDPATLDFSAAPVFQTALNYPRRCTDSAQLGPGNCFSAAWRAWTPVFRNLPATGERGIWPQPMLTDIAFDGGNLILGLRDRAGDQFGNYTVDDPATIARYYGVGGGDVLRACGDAASGWTLESNGRCGGAGAAPQNTGEGPGGAEFYFGDFFTPYSDEIAMGAMVQVPGFPTLAANVSDPIPIFVNDTLYDGGTRWLSNGTGATAKSYRIYNGSLTNIGPLGKANGLGDLAALCDAAPIEIGNRIWEDANGNGVQDAGEPGIPGIVVRLFKNGLEVAQATTGAGGEYAFNASNVAGGVSPNMAYEIRVAKAQPALTGSVLTANDRDADNRDSDAQTVGGDAVITLTTGAPGSNDHTFDIGFISPASMMQTTKCSTICFRSPSFYLLNVGNLPGGTVVIGGFNGSKPISTNNRDAIALALQGNAMGVGALTPLQQLNQEFVAAQLSVNAAGGAGSPVTTYAMGSVLSCYGLTFAPVTLSNGATIEPGAMLNALFEQAHTAIRENRTADMAALAQLLDRLNGNDPLGRCGR